MSVNKKKAEWRQASNLAQDRTQNYVTIGICLRSTFVNIFSTFLHQKSFNVWLTNVIKIHVNRERVL